ncbi:MAG: ribonuclease HII [Rikenellaceae bacterium]
MLINQKQSLIIEAGCDEAGRGCLAGSVFGAAVILPPDFYDPKLNDSKQVSPRQRERLRHLIEAEAIAWGVGEVSAQRIDEINILNAAHESMSVAVEKLSTRPELLLIDGNLFRTSLDIEYECIVGGDAKYTHIAAASILAKCHRDEYIEQLSAQFPEYGWASNKGYPTASHKRAIEEFGLTIHHRKTFSNRPASLRPTSRNL